MRVFSYLHKTPAFSSTLLPCFIVLLLLPIHLSHAAASTTAEDEAEIDATFEQFERAAATDREVSSALGSFLDRVVRTLGYIPEKWQELTYKLGFHSETTDEYSSSSKAGETFDNILKREGVTTQRPQEETVVATSTEKQSIGNTSEADTQTTGETAATSNGNSAVLKWRPGGGFTQKTETVAQTSSTTQQIEHVVLKNPVGGQSTSGSGSVTVEENYIVLGGGAGVQKNTANNTGQTMTGEFTQNDTSNNHFANLPYDPGTPSRSLQTNQTGGYVGDTDASDEFVYLDIWNNGDTSTTKTVTKTSNTEQTGEVQNAIVLTGDKPQKNTTETSGESQEETKRVARIPSDQQQATTLPATLPNQTSHTSFWQKIVNAIKQLFQ